MLDSYQNRKAVSRMLPIVLLMAASILCSCMTTKHEMPWEDAHYAKDISSTQPDSRAKERAAGGWNLFLRHHENRKKWVTENEVDYLVIGDSITFQWSRSGKEIWNKYHGHRKAANIGSSGDRTQHMLWHIQNGGLDGMKNNNPKVVQLLIGTNNRGNPELKGTDTAAGILALLKEIHHRLPNSKILLMAIFPRGWKPDDAGRIRNNEINEIIRTYADGETVIWVDLEHLFVDENGNLNKDLMKDGLHLTPKGFVAWAEAMEPLIKELLNE